MKQLVLAGAGHAHAQVLLDWLHAPLPGVELVVLSPQALAPYSGMVPGWLAGMYRFDEIAIDFAALCAAAGARWVAGELHALDPAKRRLTLADGSTLGYDLLSLNVGSTLRPPAAPDGTQLLALRPLSALHAGWGAVLQRWQQDAAQQPFHVTAVGGGAAGFEALLAVLARLRALRPDRVVHGALVARSATLLPGLAPAAVRHATRALARAGVTLQLGTAWCDTTAHGSDLLLWATGAEPQGWQADPARRGPLAVDAQGFVRIDAQLRSVSHPQVYAVGDCAAWATPLPKAGVHAVRMGPVLSRNLRAALAPDRALPAAPHRPQPRFLALLATGDGRAIGTRGGLAVEGRWVWRWKDHIDRSFVRRFALPARHPGTPQASPEDAA